MLLTPTPYYEGEITISNFKFVEIEGKYEMEPGVNVEWLGKVMKDLNANMIKLIGKIANKANKSRVTWHDFPLLFPP